MIGGDGRKYAVVYADPPWSFRVWSNRGKGRSPDWKQNNETARHYDTMTLAEIAAVPVEQAVSDDAALFLWTTDPMLPAALEIGAAWGFVYKTVGFTWAKRTRSGKGWHIGLGYWTRANAEHCLLFTRGKPKRQARDVRRLIEAPVREHSRKPDEIYERIERLVDGPYLELFARTRRNGWDAWGEQAGRWFASRALGPVTDRPAVLPGQMSMFGETG